MKPYTDKTEKVSLVHISPTEIKHYEKAAKKAARRLGKIEIINQLKELCL